jgi:hypothetical protein
MNLSTRSFCSESSCSYYRYNDAIFDLESVKGSRNFFCFQPIGW